MSRRIVTHREQASLAAEWRPDLRVATAPGPFTPTGEILEGNSSPGVYSDPSGGRWVGKPSKYEFPAQLDAATSRLQNRIGLPAPQTHVVDVNGKPASMQQWISGSPAFPDHKVDLSQMHPNDVLELQKHMAFDWAIANHDAHSGNFLRDDATGGLVGIDKGQAFKYFGKDRLSPSFGNDVNPPLYPNTPVYSTLLKQHSQGQGQLHDPRTGELGEFINGIQSIPDDEWREHLRPYAESAHQVGKLSTGDPEAFLDAAVARKNNLSNDFGNLYDQLSARRPQVQASILRQAGVVPGKSRATTSGGRTDRIATKPGWTDAEERWLAQQPQKWQDFYKDNLGDFDTDYEKAQQPGVMGLSSPLDPGREDREPVYSPKKKNPNPRDLTPAEYGESPRPNVKPATTPVDQDILPFEEDLPRHNNEPIELWRGGTIDLTHPAAAQLSAYIFGSDDQPTPDSLENGQMQLYAPDAIDDWNDPRAGDDPYFRIPPDYESPQIGHLALDYLSNDPESGSNLGRHWSTEEDVANIFAGNPYHHRVTHGEINLPYRIRAHWHGLGEDPARTNTGSDYPEESEITLLPDAPLDIQDFQIWHPFKQNWQSVLSKPQARTASLRTAVSGRTVDDALAEVKVDGIAGYDKWLAQQPPKWREHYEKLPGKGKRDFEREQLFGRPLDPSAKPGGFHKRQPVWSPNEINPERLPGLADSVPTGRPQHNWEFEDYEQDPLPFEEEMPRDRKPLELWRGKTLDLRDPAAAEIRAMIFGSDDIHNPLIKRDKSGQEQLYAPEGVMDYADYHLKYPSKKDENGQWVDNGWAEYYRKNKNNTGEPLHDIPPVYRSPELGHKILDYLATDPDSKSSLGRHWTTSPDVASEFAGGSNNWTLNEPHLLPVRARAHWKGLGEDPNRTNTTDAFPAEREITMTPGAPLDIQDLEVYHPDEDRWVSTGIQPHRRQASLRRIADPVFPNEGKEDFEDDDPTPTYELYQAWKDAYDSGGAKGKFPDWFDTNEVSDDAYEAFGEWLKNVDDAEWKEWEDDEHGLAYDNAQEQFHDYLYQNDVPHTKDEAKAKELQELTDEDSGQYTSDGYYIPGAGDYGDPDFEDRPRLFPNDNYDERRYYSPNALNPESASMARPGIDFEEEQPSEWDEQSMLPLGENNSSDPHRGRGGWDRFREHFDPPTDPHFIDWVKENYEIDDPANHSGVGLLKQRDGYSSSDWQGVVRDYDARNPQYQWPKDRRPVDLYRGLRLNLNHPELGDVRRALFGPRYEDESKTGPTDNRTIARPHPLGFDNPELGHRILDHIEQNYGTRDSGIGRHWTVSHENATSFATGSGGGQGTGQEYGGPAPNLPVRIRGEWKGLGEDPYRTNTFGHYEDEQEITMLPGAPLNIADVEIRNPQTQQWHSVLDLPHERTASFRRVGRRRVAFDFWDSDPDVPARVPPTEQEKVENIRRRRNQTPAQQRQHHEQSIQGDSKLQENWATRPQNVAQPEQLSQDTLPGMEHIRGESTPLWRGLAIDTTDPRFRQVWQMTYGQGQPVDDPGMFEDADLRYEDRGGNFDHPGLADAILQGLVTPNPRWVYNPYWRAPPQGVGGHWSTDQNLAHDYATGDGPAQIGPGGSKRYKRSPKNPTMLPVLMRGDWNGQGEDFERSTSGNYESESEISLHPLSANFGNWNPGNPNAPLTIQDLQTPASSDTSSFDELHSILPGPRNVFASLQRRGAVIEGLDPELWGDIAASEFED